MKNWKLSVINWSYNNYNNHNQSKKMTVDSMTNAERQEYYKVVENEL